MRKSLLFSVASFVAILGLFVSCKKNDSGNSQPAQATVSVINAAPGDSASYDFYFNDVKLNTQSLSYTSSSPYLPLAPKTYTVKVAASNTINPLASGSFNFNSDRTYSVFAY